MLQSSPPCKRGRPCRVAGNNQMFARRQKMRQLPVTGRSVHHVVGDAPASDPRHSLEESSLRLGVGRNTTAMASPRRLRRRCTLNGAPLRDLARHIHTHRNKQSTRPQLMGASFAAHDARKLRLLPFPNAGPTSGRKAAKPRHWTAAQFSPSVPRDTGGEPGCSPARQAS
jgi:hypothetical protein